MKSLIWGFQTNRNTDGHEEILIVTGGDSAFPMFFWLFIYLFLLTLFYVDTKNSKWNIPIKINTCPFYK